MGKWISRGNPRTTTATHVGLFWYVWQAKWQHVHVSESPCDSDSMIRGIQWQNLVSLGNNWHENIQWFSRNKNCRIWGSKTNIQGSFKKLCTQREMALALFKNGTQSTQACLKRGKMLLSPQATHPPPAPMLVESLLRTRDLTHPVTPHYSSDASSGFTLINYTKSTFHENSKCF